MHITWAISLLAAVLVTAMASEQLGTSCHQGTSPPRDNNERIRRIRNGFNHAFYQGPKSDHILVGKGYRYKTARSFSACAVYCLQEDACKSFNFCQDDKRCELNSAVYSKNGGDLVPSSGCLYMDEEFHEIELVCLKERALGMEDGTIPDNKISASSYWGSTTARSYAHTPEKARLNTQTPAAAWCAAESVINNHQWIQVDFTSPVIITGLITQGRGDDDQWVTSYTVAYGDDGVTWTHVEETDGTGPKEFIGNTDRNSHVNTTRFDPALDAQFLRILPTGSHRHVSMRFEVVGWSVAPAKYKSY